MRIVNSGTKYKIFDDSIHTYAYLPIGTYAIGFNDNEGCFLVKRADIAVTEKTYGVHNQKVKKVIDSFDSFERNLGVILSGDKGIGKSMFAKMLCMEAVGKGIPVVIVDAAYRGIARFIESIDQECLVLFDEFDKTFKSSRDDDAQAQLLSLFDGTAGGKKLFVVTCNELYGLNDYIVNRPGRFHYHFRFEYPGSTEISDYLYDKLDPKYYSQISAVVAFAHKISLNYDCLRAIAFELNLGVDFKEAVSDLNILNVNREEYNIVLHFENGVTLHQWRYRVNLFDNDGTYNWATLYNDAGNNVADLRFDKSKVVYDVRHNTTIIPAEGLHLDFSDYNECKASEPYKSLTPTYLSFQKCAAKNLHYAI